MSFFARLARLFCAAIALLAIPIEAAADDYDVAPSGRTFRVRFDPASRVTIGSGVAVERTSDGGVKAAPVIEAGVSYRGRPVSGAGSSRVAWQIDHRFASGFVSPASSINGLAFDASVYSLAALRHDELPSIVLPMSPPVAIPFPFDIGLELGFGRVYSEAPPDGLESSRVVHVETSRAGILFDPWRSGRYGSSLEIGAVAFYQVDVRPDALPGTSRVLHRVSPFTTPSARLRLQSADGLWVLDARGELTPHWTSESAWKLMGATYLSAERTLVAINDQPVTAGLHAAYRSIPASLETPAERELRIIAGLSFHVELR